MENKCKIEVEMSILVTIRIFLKLYIYKEEEGFEKTIPLSD